MNYSTLPEIITK